MPSSMSYSVPLVSTGGTVRWRRLKRWSHVSPRHGPVGVAMSKPNWMTTLMRPVERSMRRRCKRSISTGMRFTGTGITWSTHNHPKTYFCVLSKCHRRRILPKNIAGFPAMTDARIRRGLISRKYCPGASPDREVINPYRVYPTLCRVGMWSARDIDGQKTFGNLRGGKPPDKPMCKFLEIELPTGADAPVIRAVNKGLGFSGRARPLRKDVADVLRR